jgi:hypothetical protein
LYSTNAFPKSLVNDATALVAFQVASGAALAGTAFALVPTALQVVYAPADSVAIGVAVGWIGRHILTVPWSTNAQNESSPSRTGAITSCTCKYVRTTPSGAGRRDVNRAVMDNVLVVLPQDAEPIRAILAAS